MLLGMEEAIKKDKRRLFIMMLISFLAFCALLYYIFWKLQNTVNLGWFFAIGVAIALVVSFFFLFVSATILVRIKLGYSLESCFFGTPWFEVALPNYKKWIKKSKFF